MSNHKPKKVLDHYTQKENAVLRKKERDRARRYAFEATRRSIKLEVEFYHLAQVAFALLWLAVIALIAIGGFIIYERWH